MIGLGELLSGLNILEKLGKFWGWLCGKKAAHHESVATRFVRLFEEHGVHRNQIPRFIGHNLTLIDIQDDTSLLPKLTEPLLQAVCERFAVRREWLDGVEKEIYKCHDFYKRPESFIEFIDDLIRINPRGNLGGVLVAPTEQSWNSYALLVLSETVGFIGEKEISRHHLCKNWAFSYWKARATTTAFVPDWSCGLTLISKV